MTGKRVELCPVPSLAKDIAIKTANKSLMEKTHLQVETWAFPEGGRVPFYNSHNNLGLVAFFVRTCPTTAEDW